MASKNIVDFAVLFVGLTVLQNLTVSHHSTQNVSTFTVLSNLYSQLRHNKAKGIVATSRVMP
jgi:hypothetical protein